MEHLQSNSNTVPYDLAVQPYGTPLLAGSFDGTVDLDPSSGMAPLTSIGGDDGFVRRIGLPPPPASVGSQPVNALALRVFPNPSNGRVTIEVQGDIAGAKQLLITDLYGRIVHHEEAAGAQHVMDVSALAPGIYLLRCGDAVHKVVLNRQ